jgi:hypothetical protein
MRLAKILSLERERRVSPISMVKIEDNTFAIITRSPSAPPPLAPACLL